MVGFAEALSAPEVVWSLVDAGHKVVAFSRKGRRPALRHSRHVVVHEITAPEKDHAAAIADLARLLAETQAGSADRHVLLPLDDTALWLSHQVAVAGWTLATAPASCLSLALDKSRQVELARASGFNVPETFVATTPEAVLAGAKQFPLIVRPAAAVSVGAGKLSKGKNWICSDAGELRQAMAGWKGGEPLLVQPFLEGTGEGAFGIATSQGVVAWSGHRRLRMMNPHGSGSSACISQPVPPDIQRAIGEMIRVSGWRGLFMVELLRDTAGKCWFVEFNGRPWGSMALSRRQGFEYPAWTVQLALEPGFVPAAPAASRTLVCRNLGRELMHALFVVKGRKSRAIRNWPSVGQTFWQLCRLDRSTFFYNWRREDWKVFYNDCWGTIRDQIFKAG